MSRVRAKAMSLNATNGTDPLPHDTDYDAITATWIAILFIFLIGGLIAVPYMLDPTWYGTYGTYGTRRGPKSGHKWPLWTAPMACFPHFPRPVALPR